MANISLDYRGRKAAGEVVLGGSKSISNRVLIIQALCADDFTISNLSDSDDTVTLQKLLLSDNAELDAHHAGTTFRFMTAYLSTKKGSRLLTGSERMKQRPIGPLVEALKALGADITYQEKEGYPPLDIAGSPLKGGNVKIDATVSSQFLSALLLIGPTLENGLQLQLVGDVVSKSYLMMTLRIMEYFGVKHSWDGDTIVVPSQAYEGKDFYVEADWSAASYYYSMAALSEEADITLQGLSEHSLQGDSAIIKISEQFGLQTEYKDNSVRITKSKDFEMPTFFEYDFILCPDIAQTVSVMCAGCGVQGLFSGLKTLSIKETDRIAALQNELQKLGVFLTLLPKKFSKNSDGDFYMQEGKAASESVPVFPTYNDHRMAMAFAPLALLLPVEIEDKSVVSKSYPDFWKDMNSTMILS